MSDRRTISALIPNDSVAFNRMMGVLRRRGVSLASLNSSECEQEGFLRLTLVIDGDDGAQEWCVRQLEKLIDVAEVEPLPAGKSLQRELALLQVSAPTAQQAEAVELARTHGAKIVHLAPGTVTIEVSDEPIRVDHFIDQLKPLGLSRVVRTGLVALPREENE